MRWRKWSEEEETSRYRMRKRRKNINLMKEGVCLSALSQ